MKKLIEELISYENTVELLKRENEEMKTRIRFLEEMLPIALRKESNIQRLELLTVSEVAKKLKVNKSVVYELIKRKYINGLKLGNLKVSVDELDNFITRFKGKDLSDLDDIKDI